MEIQKKLNKHIKEMEQIIEDMNTIISDNKKRIEELEEALKNGRTNKTQIIVKRKLEGTKDGIRYVDANTLKGQ